MAERAAGSFPLLVPRTYLSRIRIGDPQDPLLLQVLPGERELFQSPQFTVDPVGEVDATREGGVLGKYQSRLLMVTTGVCAVHCRFCFRRHFPYPGILSGREGWKAALDQIAADPSVHEVILSGGDPLSLDDAILAPLINRLETIEHLGRLRIHTRQPVVIPQRITGELLAMLRSSRLAVVLVLHLNHPAEIDDPLASAIGRLVDAGIPVLQQGVLLRGVNDRIEVLVELYQRLVDLRVMPYYLHQLDRVAGAAHFEVSESTGIRLIQELRRQLPGYAVPRYVREIAGAPSKMVLA
jgi:EF-P beta-lysylation protein EpmB